jgi:hypothetical protein
VEVEVERVINKGNIKAFHPYILQNLLETPGECLMETDKKAKNSYQSGTSTKD